jgi:hypothetical protein
VCRLSRAVQKAFPTVVVLFACVARHADSMAVGWALGDKMASARQVVPRELAGGTT